MKIIRILILVLPILLISCDGNPFYESSTLFKEWISIVNIDSTEITYLFENDGVYPFFVADLENIEEEKILLSGNDKIELMNIDGSDRHVIMTVIGNVKDISPNRSKMVMEYSSDIYVANVDGTDLTNITMSDRNELYPTFSVTGDTIIFSTYQAINDTVAIIGISSYMSSVDSTITLFEETVFEPYHSSLRYPTIISDNVYFFRSLGAQNQETGIYKLSLTNSNLEQIYYDYVYGMIGNPIQNLLIFDHYTLDVLNLENNQIFTISDFSHSNSNSYTINNNGQYLCAGHYYSDYSGENFLYDFQNGTMLEYSFRIYKPSFNSNSSKFVCIINRDMFDD